MAINKVQLYSNETDIVDVRKKTKKMTVSPSKNASFCKGVTTINLFPPNKKIKDTRIKKIVYLSSFYDSVRISGDWKKVGSYLKKSSLVVSKNYSRSK